MYSAGKAIIEGKSCSDSDRGCLEISFGDLGLSPQLGAAIRR